MYKDDSNLYRAFRLMDRFKRPLSEIREWSPLEFEAAEAYTFRHPIDPMLAYGISKVGMMAAMSNGAKIDPVKQYPELECHYTMPDFLKTEEEQEQEMKQEIERQRKLHEESTRGLFNEVPVQSTVKRRNKIKNKTD